MILTVLAHASASLAQGTTTNPTGPEFGKASPMGLVIILVLLAGTVLLIRSMNKHIKRLPADFSPEHPEPDQAADEGTDPGVAEGDAPEAGAPEAEATKPEPAKPEAAANSEPPGTS